MEISNSAQIIKYKLILRSVSFLLLALIILSYFKPSNFFIQIPSIYLIILFSVILVLFLLLMFSKNATFIIFNEDYDQISFKYYSLRIKKGTRKSIVIKKTDFVKYEIIKKGIYKIPYIILSVRTKKGIAKYEPINLGLFKQNDVNNLLDIINKIIEK